MLKVDFFIFKSIEKKHFSTPCFSIKNLDIVFIHFMGYRVLIFFFDTFKNQEINLSHYIFLSFTDSGRFQLPRSRI